eukprot:684277-Pyramimonas_sp.AAC.2
MMIPTLATAGLSFLRGNQLRDIAPEGQQWPPQQQRSRALARLPQRILRAVAALRQAGLTGKAGRHRWDDHPRMPLHQRAVLSAR